MDRWRSQQTAFDNFIISFDKSLEEWETKGDIKKTLSNLERDIRLN